MRNLGMSAGAKSSYRALFHSAPGTGKTLTASLPGGQTERKVLRVSLSMVTSKYIGETEKNLASLFDRANNQDWILFSDEADSLFGKRTDLKDSHDIYANQEASYLLQRVKDFGGLVILASNLKSNLDQAYPWYFNQLIRSLARISRSGLKFDASNSRRISSAKKGLTSPALSPNTNSLVATL